MKAVIKYHFITALFVLFLLAMYASFAYDLARSDFPKLLSLCIGLFGLSYMLYYRLKGRFFLLAAVAMLARLLFLPAIPNLSQDFYRFIWDGRLIVQGMNPYLTTVAAFIENAAYPVAQALELYQGMGGLNASHFTNYPPINQLCFALAGWLFPKSILGSVMVLRAIVIAADIGILYFGSKLLEQLQLPKYLVFIYFLNPFVIIELTGNLHFEGVMLFFFVWGLYLLSKAKWAMAAILIGLSISVKLIPLLFLPVFLKSFLRDKIHPDSPNVSILKQLKVIHFRKLMLFYAIVLGSVFITFLPFISTEFVSNFIKTISLWFQNFEFNASVYYIIRYIGFKVVGWNIIETVGKILPIIVVLYICILSLLKRIVSINDLATTLLFAISGYLLLSTTVHPWYVATPLVLCIFTNYRYPVVWSLMVFLSYAAYGETFRENLWLVALEYVTVISYVIFEIAKLRPDNLGSKTG